MVLGDEGGDVEGFVKIRGEGDGGGRPAACGGGGGGGGGEEEELAVAVGLGPVLAQVEEDEGDGGERQEPDDRRRPQQIRIAEQRLHDRDRADEIRPPSRERKRREKRSVERECASGSAISVPSSRRRLAVEETAQHRHFDFARRADWDTLMKFVFVLASIRSPGVAR